MQCFGYTGRTSFLPSLSPSGMLSLGLYFPPQLINTLFPSLSWPHSAQGSYPKSTRNATLCSALPNCLLALSDPIADVIRIAVWLWQGVFFQAIANIDVRMRPNVQS